MKALARVLTLAAGCSIDLMGCTASDASFRDTSNYVHIATCDMGEMTTTYVAALLEAQGIPCAIWGSVAYTIDVPRTDEERAKRILWDEAVRRPMAIWFDVALDDYTLAEEESETRTLNIPRDRLLQDAANSETTDFGGVLRHEEIVKASKLFPIVVWVTTVTVEYLDSDQKYKKGHKYEVGLGKTADTESFQFTFEAFDHGRKVTFIGGFGESYEDR